MKRTDKHAAFTMIELLFVIVILGIVGGLAIQAIRNYYEGIYKTQEFTKRVATADHVLEQLSKYFENAVSISIVNLDQGNTVGCYGPPVPNDPNDYTVAFVAADNDSLRGMWNGSVFIPGWNEDVNVSGSTIGMRGGDYTIADNIITILGSDLSLSAVFNNSMSAANAGTCNDFKWNAASAQTKYLLANGGFTSSTLTTDQTLSQENTKRAYVFRSGYAFRVLDNGDFMMYDDFRPWAGTYYKNGRSSLLAQNVAHFYADYNALDFVNDPNLSDRGMVWRLKVCMRGLDENLSNSSSDENDICRERRVHVRY